MSDDVEEKGQRANEEVHPSTSNGLDEKNSSQQGQKPHDASQDEKKNGVAGVEESAAEEDDGETHDGDDDDDSEADSHTEHSQHSRHSGDRPISRTSSRQSRALVIVPRSKRRGLFAQVSIMPEVERPYDYKNSTKWTITAIIGLAGAAAPFGSSIFYRASAPLPSRFTGKQHGLTRCSRSLRDLKGS